MKTLVGVLAGLGVTTACAGAWFAALGWPALGAGFIFAALSSIVLALVFDRP